MAAKTIKTYVVLFLIVLFTGGIFTGCGSDSDNDSSDDSSPDNNPPVEDTSIYAIVNTRLDDEANISIVNVTTGETVNDILEVQDACNLTQYGDYVYIVDKTANTVTKFDYNTNTVVADMFTGESTKPYSVSFYSDEKAYIALNNETYVAIFNPETMTLTGQIDISSMAASDNKMQQYHTMIKGGKLYVTLRQNTRDDEKTSSLAVIDIATDTVIKELVLNTDGVSGMSQGALGGKLPGELTCTGDLYVNVVNSMSVTDDGAIEIIENADTEDPTSRVIYSETDFFGSMAYWVFDTNTTGWAVVGVEGNYGLIRFDLAAPGTFTKVSDFQEMEYTYALEYTDDGLVLIGAKNEDNYGIYVYDSNNNYEKVFDAPIDVGLLPNRILIIR